MSSKVRTLSPDGVAQETEDQTTQHRGSDPPYVAITIPNNPQAENDNDDGAHSPRSPTASRRGFKTREPPTPQSPPLSNPRYSADQKLMAGVRKLTDHSQDNQVTSPGAVSQGPSNKSPVKQSATLDQLPEFWEAYNNTGDKEDKELVSTSGGDLDNLLIFAGLFSAIDTAFIIESYKALKTDPADEATKLLRSMILLLHNSTYTEATIDPPPFAATPRDVRVNCLFFASLCCSLSAAFGAVLAKQWLIQYDQDGGGSLKTPAARARARQKKYEGRSKWRLEDVITTLPTLLQFSLFFFLVGLADFLWPLHTAVSSIVIGFTSATFLFYAVTISVSVIDRSAPFQTRLSTTLAALNDYVWAHTKRLVRKIQDDVLMAPAWELPLIPFRYLLTPFTSGIPKLLKTTIALFGKIRRSPTASSEEDQRAVSRAQSLEFRCFVYLLERMTVSKDLEMLAEAADSLPSNLGVDAIANMFTTFLLRPTSIVDSWRFPGLRGKGQRQRGLIKILSIALRKWGQLKHPSVHESLVQDLSFELSAATWALWEAFLADPDDLEVYNTTRQIFLAFYHTENEKYSFLSRQARKALSSPGGIGANLKKDGDLIAQERALRLACILPSIDVGSSSTLKALRDTVSESAQLRDVLQFSMWGALDQKPDLESFWLATLRIDILSSCLDGLEDSRFPEYLASWFDHFALPDWQARFPSENSERHQQYKQEQQSLYWTYLIALHRLLNHKDSLAWTQELIKYGHLWRLRIVLKDFPQQAPYHGQPLALWALLCLWEEEDVGEGVVSPFLQKDCVQTIVESVMQCGSRNGWITEMTGSCTKVSGPATIWVSRGPAAEDMAQTLDRLCSYLEEAKAGGLMDEGLVGSAIDGYSLWWKEIKQRLPKKSQYGEKHEDRSEDLRAALLRNTPEHVM